MYEFIQNYKSYLTYSINNMENLQNNIDAAASHPRLDTNGFQISLKEDEITEIAYLASRENLELGCKLIKKETPPIWVHSKESVLSSAEFCVSQRDLVGEGIGHCGICCRVTRSSVMSFLT